jgi:hypothetical protein
VSKAEFGAAVKESIAQLEEGNSVLEISVGPAVHGRQHFHRTDNKTGRYLSEKINTIDMVRLRNFQPDWQHC